ncbi:MAG: transcriptional regulator [Deltaproteobacteria bacterium]|nr:MAG: transcriptional regulator [Deltaproteobacteria bacterium]
MNIRQTDRRELKELAGIFSQISNEKEMLSFMEEIMTEKECFDLALRWKLLKAVYRGEPQRKIAEDYNISLCKITRGSKILKKQGSCSKELLKRYYKKDL